MNLKQPGLQSKTLTKKEEIKDEEGKKWEEEEEKEKKEGKETSSIRFTFFVCYGLMFMVSMPQIYTLKSTRNADINLCYTENPGG